VRNLRWLVAGALTLASCGTVLYDVPATRSADGWTITVRRLKDGPNSFPMGDGGGFVPAHGQRLLYLTVRIRNDARVKRDFSYDACDLDAGPDAMLPSLIDRDAVVHALTDKVESYDPGEERGRLLVYGYPKGVFPTRVKCGFSVVELPRF
jgi:hypothetical protein